MSDLVARMSVGGRYWPSDVEYVRRLETVAREARRYTDLLGLGPNSTPLVRALDTLTITCPDGGVCHHGCSFPACFRVDSCGPLSGVYPDDRWPDEVRAARGQKAR